MQSVMKNFFKYFGNKIKNIFNCEIESCVCGLEIKLLFEKENTFIIPDRDGYRGGMWKKFNGDGKRIGTWSVDLTKLIGE
jgi:hypothetical protein